MDWKKAFNYMFLDKEFPKIFAIGSMLMLLGNCGRLFEYLPKEMRTVFWPVLSIVAIISLVCILLNIGFFVRLIKNCNSNIDKVLPDWFRDFKSILGAGIKFFGAFLIFMIAIVICLAILVGIICATGKTTLLSVCLGILLLISFLLILLGITFLSNAFILNFVKTNSIFAFFRINAIIEIAKVDVKSYVFILLIQIGMNVATYMILLIILFPIMIMGAVFKGVLLGIVAVLCLIVACCVYFYITLVNSNLLGQYYKKYVAPYPAGARNIP